MDFKKRLEQRTDCGRTLAAQRCRCHHAAVATTLNFFKIQIFESMEQMTVFVTGVHLVILTFCFVVIPKCGLLKG